jgi:hypothetical protein
VPALTLNTLAPAAPGATEGITTVSPSGALTTAGAVQSSCRLAARHSFAPDGESANTPPSVVAT